MGGLSMGNGCPCPGLLGDPVSLAMGDCSLGDVTGWSHGSLDNALSGLAPTEGDSVGLADVSVVNVTRCVFSGIHLVWGVAVRLGNWADPIDIPA